MGAWKMKLTIILNPTATGLYRATCSALPGCSAYGRTRDDAIHAMRSAMHGYLASLDAAIPQRLELTIVGMEQQLAADGHALAAP